MDPHSQYVFTMMSVDRKVRRHPVSRTGSALFLFAVTFILGVTVLFAHVQTEKFLALYGTTKPLSMLAKEFTRFVANHFGG